MGIQLKLFGTTVHIYVIYIAHLLESYIGVHLKLSGTMVHIYKY